MDLNKIKRFEIHMHDEYSNIRLLDSINTSKKLIATAYKLGLSGCCLTNHECLSGSVVFKKNEKELKKKGELSEDFKCAIGNEIYCIEKRTRESIKYYHLILIAKNADGYEALKKLSSIAWLLSYNASRGKMRRVPTLYSELEAIVEEYKGSLICTSACLGSVFSQLLLEYIKLVRGNKVEEKELKLKEIDERINFFVKLFGEDFYIEIAPGNTKDQIEYNKAAFRYAKSRNLKIVIGVDAHYATKDDKFIHKAYLNSKDGEREVDDFYSSTYLMDNEECYNTYFKNLFTEEDFIEFCNNSMEIYEKIENYSLSKPQNIPTRDVEDYPKANLSDYRVVGSYRALEKLIQSDNPQERYWINNCLIQLNKKGLNNEEYLERLETEAEVILFISDKLNVTLVSYFNTLREIFKTILACGSIIEPGRGSSVGFLSDYLLGITQLDPIKYGLPYWRFLNNERVELPDIDIDISPSRRPKIFQKLREEAQNKCEELYKKPHEQCFKECGQMLQVATFGKEKAKSAVQTAARGYRSKEYPNGLDSDTSLYIASLIKEERGFLYSIEETVYGNEEKGRTPNTTFIKEVNKYDGLLNIIVSIENLINKRSQHAAGVIFYNNEIWKTNAVMRSPSGDLTTQFELHDSEECGDMKFDFLVTDAVDKIIKTIDLLIEYGEVNKNLSMQEVYNQYLLPENINLNENKIWESLENVSLIDTFQFDCPVGKSAAKLIKPKNIYEMTSANALMRLMSENSESSLQKYARFKDNPNEWQAEMDSYGLTEQEQTVVRKYYDYVSGVPPYQEDIMEVVMDKDISNYSLLESNGVRKIVAKKNMAEIPKLKENFFKACSSENLAKYVWDTCLLPQMGYGFSKLCSGANTLNY